MKAKKIAGVWQLKELGFPEDVHAAGKHCADVEIGLGNRLNLMTGEIFGSGAGVRRVFLEQENGSVLAVNVEVAGQSESRITGMAMAECLDGNCDMVVKPSVAYKDGALTKV